MEEDIVERLRNCLGIHWRATSLMLEAADEIRRLRDEVAMWKDRYESLLRDAQASEAHYDKMYRDGERD